jgi:Flp pilus assembly protein TadD
MAAGADPLARAAALFQEGRALEAQAALAPVIKAGAGGAQAHQLMGVILHNLGDRAGAERELRAAVRGAPGDHRTVQVLARFLASEGRDDDAAEAYADFARRSPTDAGAQYALAASLYGAGRETEAEAACRQAIALGLDRLEPWLFLGRLLNLQGRFDEAQDAYQHAVDHDPQAIEAHKELAQLVWMRTGDSVQAAAALNAAPPTAGLTAVHVKLLQDTGEERAAYALAAARAARDPSLNVLAARAALKVDPARADAHLAAAPPWVNPLSADKARIEADLALGRPSEAVRRAEALHAAHPGDHYVTALLAAAWRLAGDRRCAELYDYGRQVRACRIDPPPGWSDLDGYMADLAASLDRLHGLSTHPVGQSVRHGSQTLRGLMDYPDPPIRAFFQAIDGPIRRHIEAIGEGGAAYEISGAWSVRLNRQGYHTDHVHPQGWLSSAFYVRTPQGEGREGWIKFGQPGTPTAPPLEPEHFIRPEPGMLVLFPSYMWHGTVPFVSDETRLTCAFDVVRA